MPKLPCMTIGAYCLGLALVNVAPVSGPVGNMTDCQKAAEIGTPEMGLWKPTVTPSQKLSPLRGAVAGMSCGKGGLIGTCSKQEIGLSALNVLFHMWSWRLPSHHHVRVFANLCTTSQSRCSYLLGSSLAPCLFSRRSRAEGSELPSALGQAAQ